MMAVKSPSQAPRGRSAGSPDAHDTAACCSTVIVTEYFENEVLRKRRYLRKEWCIRVVENPIKIEGQENNRFRYWGEVEELGGQALRVVTLKDRMTIHNAFLDRGFKE